MGKPLRLNKHNDVNLRAGTAGKAVRSSVTSEWTAAVSHRHNANVYVTPISS